MELSEAKKKYIFTKRIDLLDKDFVELREPTLAEAKDFGDDNAKNFESLEKIFPDCVINSSFTENGAPATGVQVYDFLKQSASLLPEVLNEWIESIPFKSRIAKNKK